MNKLYQGITVFGPTASGKTALAVKLAQLLGGEVVNADSRQLYKGMTILTAAPTAEDMQGIPHHLFEYLDAKEKISVTEYAAQAQLKVKEILAKGKVPILCGGTGFYLKVLQEGMSDIPAVSEELVSELRTQHQALGADTLHDELKKVDPTLALKIAPKDTQRLLRALGIYKQTGRPLSYYQSLPPEGALSVHILNVSLQPSREWLNPRIEKRFSLMENEGVENEMRALYEQGYSLNDHGIQTLGAREFFQFFMGELSREEVSEEVVKQTLKYAKRQLTWARTQFKGNIVLQDPCDDVRTIVNAFKNEKSLLGV